MPEIKVQHVVSCSSEDRVHNAENLLVSDHYRKWKSAQVGEKQVTIVLQLEKSSVIHSIDIGNEGSAFVEILVGRSSDNNPSYEVLLVASSFMTAQESRQGTNTNRVRMFGAEKLSLTVSKEKWDLIKIVCTQPFNKTSQYGLSFIVFHSPPSKTEVKSSNNDVQTKIGAFKMKSTDDNENDISIGSWFAKRKSDSQDIDTQSTVSAIKSTVIKPSSDLPSSLMKKFKPSQDESSSPKTTSTNGTTPKSEKVKPNHSNKRDSPEPMKKIPKTNFNSTPHSQPSKAAHDAGGSHTPPAKSSSFTLGSKGAAPTKISSSQPSKKRAKNSRPFHKLLKGTVFVLSGYQNPQRGQIRDKAVEMGAVYKPDWEKSCTHLLCAFVNTPKYQEVHRKGGRIVTEKWVLECYRQKKLLPWRQFLLGKTNRPVTSESDCSTTDDENDDTHRTKPNIVQKDISKSVQDKNKSGSKDKPVQNKSHSRLNSGSPGGSTHSFDEDINLTAGNADSSHNRTVSRSSLVSAKSFKEDENSDAIYEAETEEDSDSGCDTESEISKVIAKNKHKEEIENSKPNTSKLGLPPLPDIFKGEHFFLFGSFDDAEKKNLLRFIIGCGGVIEDYMSDKVLCVLTHSKWNQDFTDAILDNSSVRILNPSWVIKSIQRGQLLPKKEFFVSRR